MVAQLKQWKGKIAGWLTPRPSSPVVQLQLPAPDMLRLLEQARDGASYWKIACDSDDEDMREEIQRIEADLATIESRISQVKKFR